MVFNMRSVSIISMNDTRVIDDYKGENSLHGFKPNIVILDGDSPEKLHLNLLSLKRTPGWKYTAHFYILGKIQNRCKDFKEILNATREVNIMMSIYICLNSQNIPKLYTLNPITNYAPAHWEPMESSADLNIYRQTFDLSKNV